MSKKKNKKPVTGADLRFRHFDLAKNISSYMLREMMKQGLNEKDIPQVMNDVCKFIVLSMAEVGKENALYVVRQFIDLNTDITCLMMRIVSDNFGEGLDSLKEETTDERTDYEQAE